MHLQALATDYDGTLAKDGRVEPAVIEILRRLKASGRRLILISGRQRADLERTFAQANLFDRLVLENGGVLVRPGEASVLLAEPPPKALVDALRRRGVPLSLGDVVVATWEPNETAVLEAIRELGLDYQVIFNKGAVMVLPRGINKASGLRAALADLNLSPDAVVGIGDAENDGAFLNACGCSVAVANALPSIKEGADVVTSGSRGQGVVEIAERLLADELAEILTSSRHPVGIVARRVGGGSSVARHGPTAGSTSGRTI